MLIVLPIQSKRRVKRKWPAKTGPAAPVLVQVQYAPGDNVVLRFNQAISATAFVPGAIVVNDPVVNDARYIGADFEVQNDFTIAVFLQDSGAASGSAIVLDAQANNGIIATAGGAAWAGVSEWVIE